MPLGLDDLILDLLAKRAGFCAEHSYRCESCRGTIRSGEMEIPLPDAAPHVHHDNGAPSTCSTCPYAAAGIPLPTPAVVR
jgi:hypothetical protein